MVRKLNVRLSSIVQLVWWESDFYQPQYLYNKYSYIKKNVFIGLILQPKLKMLLSSPSPWESLYSS